MDCSPPGSSVHGILVDAKSLQSCLTLWNPIDGRPPGSPVPGILQARTLEWVAISFSNAWKWKVKVPLLRCLRLLATPWTAAHQAPPSMGFSRQEYWSGVPLPSPKIYLKTNKIYFYSCRARPQAKSVLSSWGAPSPLCIIFFSLSVLCSLDSTIMETHLPFGNASTLSASSAAPDLAHCPPPSLSSSLSHLYLLPPTSFLPSPLSLSSSHNYLIKQIPLSASQRTEVATLSRTGHSLSNLQIIWNA